MKLVFIWITGLLMLISLAVKGNSQELDFWENKTVYNKVNFHFDFRPTYTGWRKTIYVQHSTNFLVYKELIPINSSLKVMEIVDDELVLRGEKLPYQLLLRFNEKHSQMSMEEYMKKNFSFNKVSLPKELSKLEKDSIRKGQAMVGIRRSALFLAIGYPPASLNDSLFNDRLRYQYTRFGKMVIDFNEKNRVTKITYP